ncbi:hypothetical protein NBT05_17255 [Aquimarina sp. ERC-38]|uniref:hypothetical protein n=1 Tax=Aquimarina sp. ERC-38 TaxID=2949996 RepID=UPI0022478A18|nr:hypothetical protein [Aquimarina sp. ERC-38]UZO80676.1 hypothetical protein NBT05_17255 [Aquimarina sp. ERC-38]
MDFIYIKLKQFLSLVFRLLIFLWVINASAQVSNEERQALVEFYNRTNGDNWKNSIENIQSWDILNPDADITNWYGIGIENGSVVSINLPDNSITGELPGIILEFLNLKNLVLNNNQIIGEIPVELYSLTNLENINLSNNGLTGILSSKINSLEKLKVFTVNNNQLTGELPIALGSLLNLESLRLQYNLFSGIINPALGSMAKLKELDLSFNQLRGSIPIAFCNLINLEKLNLSSNRLSESIPKEIGLLKKLTYFNLSNNVFTGLIPSPIGRLSNLKVINLSNNQLSGIVPFTASSSSNLEELIILNNKFIFSDIENEHEDYVKYINGIYRYEAQAKTDEVEERSVKLGDTISLQTKVVSENNFYQWYKDNQILPGKTESTLLLENVDLTGAGQYYVEITNSIITNLTLERNTITLTVSEDCKTPDTEKQALIAIYNNLNGSLWNNTIAGDQSWSIENGSSAVCNWFGVQTDNAGHVIELKLNDNNLKGTVPDVFGDLPFLQRISFHNNQLNGSFPSSISSLQSLNTLSLEGNQFVFSDLNNLDLQNGFTVSYHPQAQIGIAQKFSIRTGKDFTIPDISLEANPDYTYQWYKNGLPINNANLRNYIITNGVTEDSGMYFLEVKNAEFPNLTLVRSPVEIQVSETDDSCLEVVATEKQALIEFYHQLDGDNWTNNSNWLSNEKVCNWFGVTVEEGHITEIELIKNNLNGEITSVIENFTSLRKLNFKANSVYLGDIAYERLVNLEELVLVQCIKEIPIPSDIGKLPKIRVLALANNKHTGTIPEELGNLSTIWRLYLSGNNLTGGVPQSFTQFRNMDINFRSNNLSGTLPDPPTDAGNVGMRWYFGENNFIFKDIEDKFTAYKDAGVLLDFGVQNKVGTLDTLKIVAGQPLTINADELQSENNQYQWYKNGSLIPNATSKTFTISETSLEDVGTYHFIATNDKVPGLSLERNPIDVIILSTDICEVPQEQRQALIDLYNATDGPNWKNTWPVDDPDSKICDWYGVTVDQNYNVIKVRLFSNNLRGNIPNSIDQLMYLETLNLNLNDLIGQIPKSIGSLTNLKELALEGNNLVGRIPDEITDLVNLVGLNLSRNQFVGLIPNNIGNLQSLFGLILSSNKLEGTIPGSLYNLSKVSLIDIANNSLIGPILSDVNKLQSLTNLNVSFNQLSGNIPDEIKDLSKLRSIKLSNNRFSGKIPFLASDPTDVFNIVQFDSNQFVFSDFIDDHQDYLNFGSGYVYSPQALVDQTEIIEVELGDEVTLSTRDLTDPNNTYQWFKDAANFRTTTSREITITINSEEDLGYYSFDATNSVIQGLTLRRRNIQVKLRRIIGGDPIDTQSFCVGENEEITISNLQSPFNNTANWYTSENDTQPLAEDYLLSKNTSLWAEDSITGQRKEIPIVINYGVAIDNIDQLGYQEFLITENPMISDLQPNINGVVWYSSATGGSIFELNERLENNNTYYAQQGTSTCRFAVNVFVGVFEAEGDSRQTFCKSQGAKISDLSQRFTVSNGYELFWYHDEAGTQVVNNEEGLADNTVLYVIQQNIQNPDFKSNPKRVVISIYDVPSPIVIKKEQVFFTDDPVYISNLTATGGTIVWYDAQFEGNALDSARQLEDGGIYYAALTEIGCTTDDENCCTSTFREEVKVKIFPAQPPSLIGCEKFRPQPGAKYVISAWVKEDGVKAVNPVTINFDVVSDAFTNLLNHLLNDRLLADLPEDRHVDSRYVPKPDTREFDVLVPFIANTIDKNLTIYDFKPVKERQNGRGAFKTVGFEFKFAPGNAPKFVFRSPRVRSSIGRRVKELNFRYPLYHNSKIDLQFISSKICGTNICATYDFKITSRRYGYEEQEDITLTSSLLKPSYQSFDYISDPDYQPVNYVNSLLKLIYRTTEGAVIPQQSTNVEFQPQGAVIDGWQRISSEFRIPLEAANMRISLESTAQNNSGAAVNVHFDDIRMHPYDGSMKTFVYHPETQRLESELDENNYATYYEYDHEGGLIRVKKETERGVFTIQETRSGNAKLISKQ